MKQAPGRLRHEGPRPSTGIMGNKRPCSCLRRTAYGLSCISCNSPSFSTSRRGAEAIVSGRCAMMTRVSPSALTAAVTLALGGDVEVRRAFVHEQEAGRQ
jgi:hypothetical protein